MHNTITRFLLASSLFTACTLDEIEDGSLDDVALDETDQELDASPPIWGRLAAVGDSKCLDLTGASSDAGTKVQIYTCSDARHKTFQVETRPMASPIIAFLNRSRILGTHGSFLELDNKPMLPAMPSVSQMYTFIDNEIKAVGNCLAIENTSLSTVEMRRCQDTIHRWTYDESFHQIKGSDGRCLAWITPAMSHSNVVVDTCNTNSANQTWTHKGDGHFVAGTTNLCLNVTGANTADRAPVQLFPCSDGDRASRFSITGQLRQNGQCLGLPPNNTNPSLPDLNNGVWPRFETCDSAAPDQRWTLSWATWGN